MKKILVPCDFSKTAINAFRFALDVAEQSKGTIHLIHAIDLPLINDPFIMPAIAFDQDLLKDARQKALKELATLNTKYNKTGIKTACSVEFGSPANVIDDFTINNTIDLIVMGSHGASGLKELFIGSNAEKVVRNSQVPVLVVKQYHKGPIKDIVFPNTLDLENMQDFTLKVKALQHFFKATVHIVYINTPTNFISDAVSYQKLRAFAERFMFKDFTISTFSHQFEEDGIIEFTQSIKGDLIAMGTHGRKGVSHLVNGSLAENVVNHTQSPIWTYNLRSEAEIV